MFEVQAFWDLAFFYLGIVLAQIATARPSV
jgi:hypothetical protein